MKTVMENRTESEKEYRKLPYEVKALIDEKRLHIKKYQESKRQVNKLMKLTALIKAIAMPYQDPIHA